MTRYRTYNLILMAAYSLCLFAGLVTGWWLEPLSGDLTRIGGYAENDFGWHITQQSLARPAAQTGDRNKSYDIVVLGDSFSMNRNASLLTPTGDVASNRWTDFFAKSTGLSVGLFNANSYTLDQVLAGSGYRRAPPRALIYESVERALRTRLSNAKSVCRPPTRTVALPPTSIREHPLDLVPVTRDTVTPFLRPQIGQAFGYLLHRLKLEAGLDPVPVLALRQAGLFSDRHPSSLLVFGDDLLKKDWSNRAWGQFGCAFESMQDQVQANGKTSFLLLIAPDKLTAYAPFLADPEWQNLSHLRQLLDASPVNAVRSDTVIAALVAGARPDVYLPDDTHWGWFAEKAIAAAVLQKLEKDAVLRIAPQGPPMGEMGR